MTGQNLTNSRMYEHATPQNSSSRPATVQSVQNCYSSTQFAFDRPRQVPRAVSTNKWAPSTTSVRTTPSCNTYSQAGAGVPEGGTTMRSACTPFHHSAQHNGRFGGMIHEQPRNCHQAVANDRGQCALDSYQASCIMAEPSANIVVHACPGAGKSTTIANRCKALVDSGVKSERILVLTFSKASAEDLELKLKKIDANLPSVQTYHSFALSLIRKLPGPYASSRVIQAGQQRKLLRRLIPADMEKSAARRRFKRVISLITKAKATEDYSMRNACSSEVHLLQQYNSELRNANMIDFDDMIALATETIRGNESMNGVSYDPHFSHLLLEYAALESM